MGRKKLVAVAEVGRKTVFSEKHTMRFIFHDFKNLPHKRGDKVASEPVLCHGHLWTLEVYPGGDRKSDENEVHVSVFLARWDRPAVHGGTDVVEVKYALRVDSAGLKKSAGQREFSLKERRGWHNCMKRADVLDSTTGTLSDGSLSVEVDIQVGLGKPIIWTPNKTLNHDMLAMLKSCELADVTFVIGDTNFAAHQCVLKLRAPGLAELAEEFPQQDVPIPDVDPSIFQALLHFIYSDELPPETDLKEHAVALLNIADKYGCTSAKLVAEAKLVETGISVETASDMLILADSKNCALLKEAAVSFFVANRDAVMTSQGFSKVEESNKLLLELMRAKPMAFADGETDVDTMSVAMLRRNLTKRGITDVDGTREILSKRLKTSSEQEVEEA